MRIYLVRYSSGKEDTLGLLFVDGKFFCYTVEDEYRAEKVHGETRIPNGTYTMNLRRYGDFHRRNELIFGFPDGMIGLQSVEGFTNILIHWGNSEADTEGCILVGEGATTNRGGRGSVIRSRNAYKKLYPVVRDAIKEEGAEIVVTDDISQFFPSV